MESVVSKNSTFLLAGIGILVLLGFVGPIIGLEFIPLWVSITFWVIAFGMLFGIYKNTFTSSSITTTYLISRRTNTFNKENIRTIKFMYPPGTTDLKKRQQKKNRIIQITREDGKNLTIDEKINTNFQAVQDLLEKHFSKFFVR